MLIEKHWKWVYFSVPSVHIGGLEVRCIWLLVRILGWRTGQVYLDWRLEKTMRFHTDPVSPIELPKRLFSFRSNWLLYLPWNQAAEMSRSIVAVRHLWSEYCSLMYPQREIRRSKICRSNRLHLALIECDRVLRKGADRNLRKGIPPSCWCRNFSLHRFMYLVITLMGNPPVVLGPWALWLAAHCSSGSFESSLSLCRVWRI